MNDDVEQATQFLEDQVDKYSKFLCDEKPVLCGIIIKANNNQLLILLQ